MSRETPAAVPPSAHRLSTGRLFAILLLFLVAAGYAIWKSERFQNLIQGVSQARLSAALGRPVLFRTVEVRIFPPSVSLADVRIANDPRLPGDLLSAEQITIGGGVSLVGRELRLGRIRALRPRVTIVQFPDGSLNLPPGLSGPSAKGGVKLRIGSVLVQEGMLAFQGRKMALDGRFDDFSAELKSVAPDRYSGSLFSRRATVKLSGNEPIVAEIAARFQLDSKRGATLDEITLSGAFGRLRASGALENPGNANTVLFASGDVSLDEIERIFHSDLGFSGGARVRARLEFPPSGSFRITGDLAAPRVRAHQFVFEDFAASVTADRDALIGRIDKATYCGGRASGVFRIGNLSGKPQPMTLAIEGQKISLERFFGDLDLKGTGLSGGADLSIALRWGAGGIAKSDGGGSLRIEPGPASSIVAGRHGLPTSGGGGLAVVNGKILFESVTLRFPQSSIDLAGGLKIGVWQPDFDFHLRSRDLVEVDHLFQNFVSATGERPEPLGLGGSGELQGHLAGTWVNPDATVQVSAEQARYAGVPFGSVRGTVDMRQGAFFFRPLRIYDGDASLSLEGMTRYRQDPRLPKLDLSVAAHDYPLSRLLQYLQLDYPIEGKLSGSFPIAGNPDALTGGGAMRLADATAWGQKFPLVTARALFTPGRFAVEDLRAAIGAGMVGGSAAIAFKAKTFEARLAGDAIPLESVEAFRSATHDVTGSVSFQLSGSGSLDRPDAKLSASLSHATFFDHPVPDAREPRIEATLSRGVLESSITVPDHWTFTARGDLFGEQPRVDVALDAADLNSFFLFTPLDVAPGRGGSLAINGNLTLPKKKGELPTGTFTVTRARLDMPDRPGVLETRGQVRIALSGGKLTFDEFEAAGEGTNLKISGSVGLTAEAGGLAVAIKGPIDASLVSLVLPDTVLSGKLTADVRAAGTLQKPALFGSVRIEKGKYRLTGLAQIVDDIDGSITFQGSRADLDARARFGGGDAYASGSFAFQGLSLQEFRISLQGRHVALRYPQDLRLVVDADLVASGGAGNGNVIRGEVLLLRGTYSKDFEVSISDLLARTRPSSAVGAREPWKEKTALEVRIVSSASLEVRNNLARLTATVDLVARGTVANPTLLGQILLDEGGRITFRDVRYDIESGTIAFANREGFTPIIDIRARAEIKGYDLIVNLVGTWPRIQTSFSSDPPLPDETIVGLLLTGTEPGARTTTDTSGQIVSAAGGIVAGAVTSPLTRRTQRFFKLDRFEIDPVFSGTQSQTVDVRSTVGKQITPNLLVTYSQSFDTAKEPIFKLEWRISDTIVLQGRRDENGIYLIDIRRRQRF